MSLHLAPLITPRRLFAPSTLIGPVMLSSFMSEQYASLLSLLIPYLSEASTLEKLGLICFISDERKRPHTFIFGPHKILCCFISTASSVWTMAREHGGPPVDAYRRDREDLFLELGLSSAIWELPLKRSISELQLMNSLNKQGSQLRKAASDANEQATLEHLGSENPPRERPQRRERRQAQTKGTSRNTGRIPDVWTWGVS